MCGNRDIDSKNTETNAVEENVHIMNTISAVKVTLPSSERERNSLGSFCIPESAHDAQVSTTLAMFWLKSRTLSER